MAIYKIADFIVELKNKYDYTDRQCQEYRTEDSLIPDFSVSVTEEEIEKELAVNEISDRGYAESVCIYRNLCFQILSRDAFLLHAAVVEVDGRGYAFLARSGVGKSTHIRLWNELLGDKLTIVNGDKPIVRLIDGKFYAYGTPWCGKDGINKNMKVPLKAICFLRRGEKNTARRLMGLEAISALAGQTFMRFRDKAILDEAIKHLESLVQSIPSQGACVWIFPCPRGLKKDTPLRRVRRQRHEASYRRT